MPVLRLHDAGGWDASGRYLLTAADLSTEVAVLDTEARKRVAVVEVSRTSNPARGSSLDDPEFGPVRASAPLNPDPSVSQKVAVFDIDHFDAGFETLPIAWWAGLDSGPKRVVQPEFNAAGDEVWFSVWNGPGKPGAIVVVDDRTRELKAVIKDELLIAPAQKFNIHNTLHDAQ